MNNYTNLFRFITSPYEKEGVYISSIKSKTITYDEMKSKVARLNLEVTKYNAFNEYIKEYYIYSSNNRDTNDLSENNQNFGIGDIISKLYHICKSSITELTKKKYDVLSGLDDILHDFEFTNTKDQNIPFSEYVEISKAYELVDIIASLTYKLLGEESYHEKLHSYMTKNHIDISVYKLIDTEKSKVYAYRKLNNNKIFFASSLKDIRNIVQRININKNNHSFYRGHDTIGYPLIPSLYRKKSYSTNEANMFNSVLKAQYREFNKLSSIQDYLSKMQHYGLPTRLLDITSSVDVAAYFASKDNGKDIGEIFLFDFDEKYICNSKDIDVEILASLAVMNEKTKTLLSDEKSFSKHMSHILGSIKKAYTHVPGSFEYSRFFNFRIVVDSISNDRVFNQKGSFIIFGLDFPEISTDTKFTTRIFIYNKKQIREDLENQNINHQTMFPELDNTCSFVRSKY